MNSQKLQSELQRQRPWFIAKETAENLDLYIYDVIGPNIWEDGVRASDLVKTITSSKAPSITCHINSPGGGVFEGISIHNALKDSGKRITTITDGIAASIASVIFCAGSTRRMGTGTMLMAHNAWGFAVGDYEDMAKMSTALNLANEQLIGIYSSCGIDPEQMRDYMKAETYFDAADAVELGLATEAAEDIKIAACAWNLDILSGEPERFKKIQKAKEKRNVEKALRDAGFSANEAKRMAAITHRDDAQEDADIAAILKTNIAILTQ